MPNWIEIRTFCRHVDKTNVVGCQQVMSGPGCMIRGIVLLRHKAGQEGREEILLENSFMR